MIWGVPISAVRVLFYSAPHACTNISATDMTRSWSLERLSAYRSRPWRCTSLLRTLLENATSVSCSAHPATSLCKLNSSSAFGQSTYLHHLHLTPPTYKSRFSLHYHFIFVGHVINNSSHSGCSRMIITDIPPVPMHKSEYSDHRNKLLPAVERGLTFVTMMVRRRAMYTCSAVLILIVVHPL